VNGTQSDATYYHPEQNIIETHNQYSLAIRNKKISPGVYRLVALLFR
jgi:hypothetical protein